MTTFVTKDSGKRIKMKTGAVRDVQQDKPRYDLIPVLALQRVAHLYRRGAEKYSQRNWQRGIPVSRMVASSLRHMYQYIAGDRTQDHLAAVVFNVLGIMFYQEKVNAGQLPRSLLDLDFYKRPTRGKHRTNRR